MKIFHIGPTVQERELRNQVELSMLGRRRECGGSTVDMRVGRVATEGRRLAWT